MSTESAGVAEKPTKTKVKGKSDRKELVAKLLRDLEKASKKKDAEEARRLRARLRTLGHKGGLKK